MPPDANTLTFRRAPRDANLEITEFDAIRAYGHYRRLVLTMAPYEALLFAYTTRKRTHQKVDDNRRIRMSLCYVYSRRCWHAHRINSTAG